MCVEKRGAHRLNPLSKLAVGCDPNAMAVREQALGEGNIWLYIAPRTDGQEGEVQRLVWLERKERGRLRGEHIRRCGFRQACLGFAQVQWVPRAELLQDQGVVARGCRRTRIARVQAAPDLFELTLDDGDEFVSAFFVNKLEKQLLVAFHDDDETVMSEAVRLLLLGSQDVFQGQYHLKSSCKRRGRSPVGRPTYPCPGVQSSARLETEVVGGHIEAAVHREHAEEVPREDCQG